MTLCWEIPHEVPVSMPLNDILQLEEPALRSRTKITPHHLSPPSTKQTPALTDLARSLERPCSEIPHSRPSALDQYTTCHPLHETNASFDRSRTIAPHPSINTQPVTPSTKQPPALRSPTHGSHLNKPPRLEKPCLEILHEDRVSNRFPFLYDPALGG